MVAKAKIPAGDYTSPNELKFDISLITKDSKAGIGTGKNLKARGKFQWREQEQQQCRIDFGLFSKDGQLRRAKPIYCHLQRCDRENQYWVCRNGKFANTDKAAAVLPDHTFTAAQKGIREFSTIFKNAGQAYDHGEF